MIDATEFNIKRMQTVICALLSCGEEECMDLYKLAKNGYLDEALKRVVEERQEVPNFNNLWVEAICEAYVEIFGGDPAQELYLDVNSMCSRVFRRVEHLNASLKEEFEEKTGYELEDAYDMALAEDCILFGKFEDYLLNTVAKELEVEDDPEEGLTVSEITINDWRPWLQARFDEFTEKEQCEETAMEQVAAYLLSEEMDDINGEGHSLWTEVDNRAIENYKEGLETRRTEEDLNRTYR